MKKQLLTLMAVFTFLGLVNTSSAFYDHSENKHKSWHTDTDKQAIHQAIISNDYETWASLIASKKRFEQIVTKYHEHKQKISEKLGLTVEELQAELNLGKTIRDIAEEKGVDLYPNKTKRMNELGQKQNHREHMAEKLGLTLEELKSALSEGKTIRELAEEKNVELPTKRLRSKKQSISASDFFQKIKDKRSANKKNRRMMR